MSFACRARIYCTVLSYIGEAVVIARSVFNILPAELIMYCGKYRCSSCVVADLPYNVLFSYEQPSIVFQLNFRRQIKEESY